MAMEYHRAQSRGLRFRDKYPDPIRLVLETETRPSDTRGINDYRPFLLCRLLSAEGIARRKNEGEFAINKVRTSSIF